MGTIPTTGVWQPIETIPVGKTIEVRTVTGIECLARHGARGGSRWLKWADRWGPKRAACTRQDGRTRGDVVAVAWRIPVFVSRKFEA